MKKGKFKIPTCPHCGKDASKASWSGATEDGDTALSECHWCNESYWAEATVDIVWTTSKPTKKQLNDD